MSLEIQLSLYKDLKHKLRRNRSRYTELKELNDFPKKSDTKQPTAKSQTPKPLAFVIELEDLEKEESKLQLDIVECGKKLGEYTAMIENQVWRSVVEDRLMYCRTWGKVANANNYSKSQARVIFKNGLKELERISKEETKGGNQ